MRVCLQGKGRLCISSLLVWDDYLEVNNVVGVDAVVVAVLVVDVAIPAVAVQCLMLILSLLL